MKARRTIVIAFLLAAQALALASCYPKPCFGQTCAYRLPEAPEQSVVTVLVDQTIPNDPGIKINYRDPVAAGDLIYITGDNPRRYRVILVIHELRPSERYAVRWIYVQGLPVVEGQTVKGD